MSGMDHILHLPSIPMCDRLVSYRCFFAEKGDRDLATVNAVGAYAPSALPRFIQNIGTGLSYATRSSLPAFTEGLSGFMRPT